ncbi:MAG: type I-B CRISPR-associated protein Cas7/Cst2/DevR, partial [Candidatus Aminicenantes bacterium]|nr:type I-B CRISPR-associated protein Cas7/Cst2/DevR [Candidatus Aminicenantes bacterium]
PLFIIGGVYNLKNPFFMNNVKVDDKKLNVVKIQDILHKADEVEKNTQVGYVAGTFANDEEIKKLNHTGLKDFFQTIDGKIKEYYHA